MGWPLHQEKLSKRSNDGRKKDWNGEKRKEERKNGRDKGRREGRMNGRKKKGKLIQRRNYC